MSWAKLDDGFPNNPKVAPLTLPAKWLYVTSVCYSARNLTDGALSGRAVKVVVAEADVPKKHVSELHHAGLWDRAGDGYLIHDYLEYNPRREKVLEERNAARQRMGRVRATRAGTRADHVDYQDVYDRASGVCRICSLSVDFDDAEFDHIVPISKGGEHTADNLAPTHRRCNRAKRTNGSEYQRGFGRTQPRTQTGTSGEGSGTPSRPVEVKTLGDTIDVLRRRAEAKAQ